jgi:hypothetical protein
MPKLGGSDAWLPSRLVAGVGAVFAALLLTSAARADVAPPDSCNGAAGQPCNNAA